MNRFGKLICIPFLLGLLTMSAAAGVLISPAPVTEPWGVTMTLQDVTSTGAGVTLSQSGGSPSGRLQTGADYWLEVRRNGQWESMEVLPDDLAWISIAYQIPTGGSWTNTLEWESIYGELPAGEYRLGKTVMDFRESGDYTNRAYYAEFTITPDKTSAWSNPFADVERGDWFYEAVEYVYKSGLMAGTAETSFDPHLPTTRGQIVTMLWRLEGSPSLKNNVPHDPFADIDVKSYYSTAIYWARLHGIVDGYDGRFFRPAQPVTRQQLATILWRYAKYIGKDVSVGEHTNILSYTDAFAIADYAIPAIQWACGAGILSGYDDGRLDPIGQASRAHTAQMLFSFSGKIEK